MAFGTQKITVRYRAARFALFNTNNIDNHNEIVYFWQQFYDQSCLEYIYVNNLRFSKVLLRFIFTPSDDLDDEHPINISLLANPPNRMVSAENILIPLGGTT
jgi:hypothetical protein